MRICDWNTFYCPRAGGIRTYHEAKLAWFARHPEHEYLLIAPGPGYRVRREAPNVRVAEVHGMRTGSDPNGYRLLLDVKSALGLISGFRADILEAGDPWITGPASLVARKLGFHQGLTASFYHSDPIRTYLRPWLRSRYWSPRLRVGLDRLLAGAFYRLQGRYDATLVSSAAMESHLRARCPRAVVMRTPFGVDASFLAPPPPRDWNSGPIRLLYAGRLDAEKGVGLLLEALPRLLTDEGIEVSVAGRGTMAGRFEALRHPRFHYHGYISGRGELLRLYHSHHIFAFPGAYETFGLAVLEAMAAGMVPVAPDAGGAGEIVAEVSRELLFAPGKADAFEQAIRRAAGKRPGLGPEIAPAHSGRARKVAEAYGSWDNAFDRMYAGYASLPAARDAGNVMLPTKKRITQWGRP